MRVETSSRLLSRPVPVGLANRLGTTASTILIGRISSFNFTNRVQDSRIGLRSCGRSKSVRTSSHIDRQFLTAPRFARVTEERSFGVLSMSINLSRHFLLRKLHQLTGILPLGVFLLEHFYTNSKALGSIAAGRSGLQQFNEAVADLQSIPYVLFVEILGIFVPLIYHGIYGLIITYQGRPNVGSYDYLRNWMYLIQRVTGVILFLFITFHVLNFRFGLVPGLNELPVADNPGKAFQIVHGEFVNPLILFVYFLGIVSTTFHFANGLWLFLVDWGVTVGRRAQRVSAYACAALGVALTFVGINSALAFVR